MDAETRDLLADTRRKRRGLKTPSERDKEAAELAVAAWNEQHPSGTAVDVRMDDGTVLVTHTRSIAWLISNHASVLVDGISGGYLLERVTPRPTVQQQTCDHAKWLDSVDVARRPIRTCSSCGARLQVMDLDVDDIADLLALIETKLRWYDSYQRSSPQRRAQIRYRYRKLLERVRAVRRG